MVLRIFKIIATRGFLTALECTEFVSAGAPPRTSPGELTALPRPSSWFKGPYFQGGGKGKKRVKR